MTRFSLKSPVKLEPVNYHGFLDFSTSLPEYSTFLFYGPGMGCGGDDISCADHLFLAKCLASPVEF